jgi:small GTP-binding protein
MIDVKRKLRDPDEPASIIKSIKKTGAVKNFDSVLNSFHSTKIPVEIASKGVFAITEYLKSLKNEIKLFEAKMIVVGGGAVGKTSLMKRLLFEEFSPDENITQGIEINNWLLNTEIANNLKINFWDFGGQEIYHATHQFFLTKRSLYIFVWEARKDDDLRNFDYWLNIIKLLSDESPVLIVLNKVDQNIKLIDELSLKKKFKNIVGFFKVSAKTGKGIENLRLFIRREIIKLPQIGNTLPQLWLEIRSNLERIDENYIEYNQYKKICENFGIGEDSIEVLSQYLHDLGVFLHFQDNPILKEIIFLKPEWATNAVYQLVNTKRIRENGGKFNYNELNSTWAEYPENKYIFLLELMKRFELCFQIPNSQDYILPQLLPPHESNFEWNYEDNVRFEYHYEFMPSGIIARFIVRNHDLIENNLYWQNGVVLNWENSRALIIGDPFKKEIKIRLRGVDPRIFLEIIRRDIDVIHKSLNYPEFTELLPCTCSRCSEHNNPHLFDYSVLKKFKEKKKRFIPCLKSTEDVSIENLLNGIERTLTIREMFEDKMKRVFSDDQYKSKNIENIRIINVFLASSGNLKQERERVELELSRRNSLLISQNIYLDLKIWEKAPSDFSITRKQDDFNKLVLESDIFICLIFDRVGEFTKEEVLTAYKGFMKNKRPKKIYVYFKNAPIETGEISKDFQTVIDFKNDIKKLEQFYSTYKNQDDLILQINKNLEMDLKELKK